MKVEANVKQELIVDAAIRRFSHFGIAKTTLTEVAEDMAVSKQALSYYFADKQSLVNAVIEKITIEYGDRLRTEMGKAARKRAKDKFELSQSVAQTGELLSSLTQTGYHSELSVGHV